MRASFILSHADTFGPSDPRTFLFFSAVLVYTFLFRETLAFSGVLHVVPALAATSKGSIGSANLEFLSISADHLRLLPQIDNQGNSVFCLQKVFYAKSSIKATDALN